MTQSPKMTTNTANRRLTKGPGYLTIYQSDFRKAELSNQTLRVTDIKSGKSCIYQKILDSNEKQKIEHRSENWKRWSDHSLEYWILEQRNTANKPLGIVKIILKRDSFEKGVLSRKIIARNENAWRYYAKKGAEV